MTALRTPREEADMALVRTTDLTWLLTAMAALTFTLGMQSGSALAAPRDQDVFTDFEGIDSSNFSVGTGDVTATFTNGFSAFAGILELYNSGRYAWMVDPGNTGEIQFETNAAIVDFFARTRSTADGPSVLTAFDSQGQVVDSVTLTPGDPFQEVIFTGSIARIEFANNASEGCVSCMNSIDDFGFSPVTTSDRADPVIDFGGIGLWGRMNDSSWLKLHNGNADIIATGDVDGNGADDVLAGFGSTVGGFWGKLNLGGWTQLNANSPDDVVSGDVSGNGEDDIVADFGTTVGGLFIKRDQGAWTKLHNTSPESLAIGDLDSL